MLLQASAPSKHSFNTTSSSGHASGPAPSALSPWELPPTYPAYGMAPLPSIPPGYALVAPNLLLPLDALQARPCILHAVHGADLLVVEGTDSRMRAKFM